jgi:hypothetical protein
VPRAECIAVNALDNCESPTHGSGSREGAAERLGKILTGSSGRDFNSDQIQQMKQGERSRNSKRTLRPAKVLRSHLRVGNKRRYQTVSRK